MRIHILSDLHTEFVPFTPPEVIADIIVAAGDIGVGIKGVAALKSIAPHRPVIYVAGNHEYYGGAIPRTTFKIRDACANSNVHFLENDCVVLHDVRFLGCTLWTDFRLFGQEGVITAALACREKISDFKKIRLSPDFRKITPKDVSLLHAQSRRWLETMLADRNLPTVVVTHHAPIPQSLGPDWQRDLLHAAYASDLTRLIETSKPAVWIHGHTHRAVDMHFHQTRVISNPRAYPDEPVQGFDPSCMITL